MERTPPKRTAVHPRYGSGRGESSRQGAARASRAADRSSAGQPSQQPQSPPPTRQPRSQRSWRPPPAQSSQPRPIARKILRPRLIDFESLESLFPMLSAIFAAQGWMDYVSVHKKYYPALVQEFYANFYEEEDRFFTTVSGKLFEVSHAMLSRALRIPDRGGMTSVHHVSLGEAHLCMTGRDPVGVNLNIVLYNANEFPAMQRMLHHILTTIVYPKAGSRELVNNVHKFLMTYLVRGEAINLCDLMIDLFCEVVKHKNRSLPYANVLSPVFELNGIRLSSEQFIEIPLVDVYTAYKVQTFMGYHLVDGVVRREIDVSSSDEEEEEGEEGDGPQDEDLPAEAPQAPEQEQPAQDQDRAAMWEEALARQSQRLDALDSRMTSVEEHVAYCHTALSTITDDLAEMRITQNEMFHTLNSHIATQTQFFNDMRRYFQGAPPDDPNM